MSRNVVLDYIIRSWSTLFITLSSKQLFISHQTFTKYHGCCLESCCHRQGSCLFNHRIGSRHCSIKIQIAPMGNLNVGGNGLSNHRGTYGVGVGIPLTSGGPNQPSVGLGISVCGAFGVLGVSWTAFFLLSYLIFVISFPRVNTLDRNPTMVLAFPFVYRFE